MAVKLATKLKRYYGFGRYGVLKRAKKRAPKLARRATSSASAYLGRVARAEKYVKAARAQVWAHRRRGGLTIAAPLAASGGVAYGVRRRKKRKTATPRKKKRA